MPPDSASDPVGSQGFASFRLKPMQGLPANAALENAADIFFDINDPIRSNTSVLVTEFSVSTVIIAMLAMAVAVDGASAWLRRRAGA